MNHEAEVRKNWLCESVRRGPLAWHCQLRSDSGRSEREGTARQRPRGEGGQRRMRRGWIKRDAPIAPASEQSPRRCGSQRQQRRGAVVSSSTRPAHATVNDARGHRGATGDHSTSAASPPHRYQQPVADNRQAVPGGARRSLRRSSDLRHSSSTCPSCQRSIMLPPSRPSPPLFCRVVRSFVKSVDVTTIKHDID